MCSYPLYGVDVAAAEGEPGVARVGVPDYGGVNARWDGAALALRRLGAEQGLSLVAPCQVWVVSCGPGIDVPELHLTTGASHLFKDRADHIPLSEGLFNFGSLSYQQDTKLMLTQLDIHVC